MHRSAARSSAVDCEWWRALSAQVHSPSTRRALILAIALYLLWVVATYLLEGRIFTLQHPEDIGPRLIYTLVANILIGVFGSVLVATLPL